MGYTKNRMSSQSQQNEVINMSEVIERLKVAIGVRTDAELARSMKESPKKIGVWKARNTVPTEGLVRFCAEHQLDLQYILTGQKCSLQRETTDPTLSVFPELDLIFKEAGILWKNLDQSERYELASKMLKNMSSYKPS